MNLKSLKPPMVLAYLRYSSDGQKVGDSIDRQEASAVAFAEQQGWTLSPENVHADKAVSAFRRKNLVRGKFAEIAKRCKDGRIPQGSVLIVEALDRISRAEVSEALEVILHLINNGLRIVTLKPEPKLFSKGAGVDTTALILAIVYLGQATGESEMKSVRSARNWDRRRKAAQGGAVISESCPGWLEVVGDKYEPIPSAKKTVKEIFRLCCLGYGTIAIAKMLTKGKVKPIGRGAAWSSTYVRSVIGNPATYGVWQPHKIIDGVKTKLEPVAGYYPAVVDQDTFDKANKMIIERRKRKTGGSVTKYVNVYNGLLYDESGKPYTTYANCRKDYRTLLSYACLQGGDWQALREDVFDFMFFNVVGSKNAKAFMPAVETKVVTKNTTDLAKKRKQLANIARKIEALKAAILSGDDEDTSFVELLPQLDQQRKALQVEIDDANELETVSDSARIRKWCDFCSTSDKAKMTNDERMELRAILRNLVKRVVLRTKKEDKLISGDFVVTPVAGGDDILCRFTYSPFAGRVKRLPYEMIQSFTIGDRVVIG